MNKELRPFVTSKFLSERNLHEANNYWYFCWHIEKQKSGNGKEYGLFWRGGRSGIDHFHAAMPHTGNFASVHPQGVGRGCIAYESATTTYLADIGLHPFGRELHTPFGCDNH